MYLLLIFGITLLPQVSTLSCYHCEMDASLTCRDQLMECSAEINQCVVSRVMAYSGGSKLTDIVTKSCGLSEQCFNGTIKFGSSRTTFASKCCNSNSCNKEFTPDAINENPNGLKCFGCNGKRCTETVECTGSENRCISTEVPVGSRMVSLKGCASKQMCEIKDIDRLRNALGGTLDCCQGNFCNGVMSGSAGTFVSLLLVASLTSLIMFT